ncbi:MAG: beta-galactosidase [Prevotella sp.]|nr:beta-galactosidase [Prevotella sp.]
MFKRLLYLLLLLPGTLHAQLLGDDALRKIYEEVKSPYKYGMVIAPQDTHHQVDCPTVFREKDRWYMTYVVYNGKDGLEGRGYETWLAESNDLLHWTTLGRLLSYRDSGWDMNQRGGFPALIDWTWGGSYAMQPYKGQHWMTYIGGHGTGYEAVREPLNIGLAWTKGDITRAHEWSTATKPLLSIADRDAEWWEKLVQYKSTIYLDRHRQLGKRFVMFYNAGGINPANQMKAERIGIATSNDLRHWTRYAGNPVYFHEAPGIITGDAQIVRMERPDLGKEPLYVMFYFSAYNPTRRYDAFNTFSVSRDLIHWQDWTGPDLIYPTKPYDNLFAHKSCVVKHEGIVYHFYCAVNRDGQRGIAVATSTPMGRSAVRFPRPDTNGRRTAQTLDENWQVRFLHTTEDSLTRRMGLMACHVPHNLDDYYGYRQLKHGNLHGSALYSRELTVTKTEGRRYFLRFEGVGTYATVMLNGHAYDKHLVGRTTYTLDVTDALRSGANHLEVLVDHPAYQTASPWVCGGCSAEWGFSEGSQPFGIFRPVTLETTDEVRVEPFGVHIWNNAACDSVFIDTEVRNYGSTAADIELVSKLNQASGKTFFRLAEKVHLEAGETRVLRQRTAVSDVHRWSVDDPYLYRLASMIKRADGKTTDELTTEYGIRSLSWPVHRKEGEPKGVFLLNGQPMFINGTCDYEHLFGASHAFSHEQIASRVKLMRQAGFNAFREAHQPHNLYYQQLLDEQGMLFWSQFSAHIWYDTPQFREMFKQKLRQWIKERRNSPSVILWGLQNESVLPRDFAEECSRIIREMDPTCLDQRAITTCNGGEGTDWNVVQNWSGTYGGSAADYDRELASGGQLLNGEYGAWRTLGLHGSGRYSEEAADSLLQLKTTKALAVRDSVCGHFQWLFVSHENPGRVQPDEALRRIDKVGPFNYKGLLTPWEQPTQAYYGYRDRFVGAAADTLTPTAADRHPVDLKAAEGYTYLYRVNCGGDAYTDRYGQTWLQDDTLYSSSWAQLFGLPPFTASQGHITQPIHGTDDDALFQYFRWGRHRLNYHFNVPDGTYRIELYFAEPWLGARYGTRIDCEGSRIFDVAVNGRTVIQDLDLWAEAGYAGAFRQVVEAEARQGQLVISFPEVKAGQAVISAVAIARQGKATDLRREPLHGAGAEGTLPPHYWQQLDQDTLAVYPKTLLPQAADAFPAVKYQPTGRGRWTISPGVAKEYALRFRYKNTTSQAVKARLRIIDSKKAVLRDAVVTFPPTPAKYKTMSTTTATQINAGSYQVILTDTGAMEFEILEIQ